MARFWTLEEIEAFEKDWLDSELTIPRLMSKYVRTRDAIHRKAKSLGLASRKNIPRRDWTTSDIKAFKEDFIQMPMALMKLKYNRTERSLYRRGADLGLKRKVEQSMELKIEDLTGKVLDIIQLKAGPGLIGRRKAVMRKLLTRNKRAIDRGEWILSITHNLECYE